MDYTDQLKQIERQMNAESAALHKVLKSAPKGTIRVSREGKFIRISKVYYDGPKLIRKGIKSKPQLVNALYKKAMYTEYVRRLDRNSALLTDAINKMQPTDNKSVMAAAPANIELIAAQFTPESAPPIHPIYTSDVQIKDFSFYVADDRRAKWGAEAYRANAISPESKRHITLDGVALRSKSELALFEIYRRHGIPVHYDQVIRIGGQIKSPDFIAMRRDGKLILHEHCGLVNDPNYIKAHNEKMRLYESFGITPWDNLIITYDSPDGGIDLRLAEAEICSKLEP